MTRIVANNWARLTGGAEGISLPDLPRFLGLDLFSRRVEFYLALILLGLALVVAWWLQRGRVGYHLPAIRGGEGAAHAPGIKPTRDKGGAFLAKARLPARGGALYVHCPGLFTP